MNKEHELLRGNERFFFFLIMMPASKKVPSDGVDVVWKCRILPLSSIMSVTPIQPLFSPTSISSFHRSLFSVCCSSSVAIISCCFLLFLCVDSFFFVCTTVTIFFLRSFYWTLNSQLDPTLSSMPHTGSLHQGMANCLIKRGFWTAAWTCSSSQSLQTPSSCQFL